MKRKLLAASLNLKRLRAISDLCVCFSSNHISAERNDRLLYRTGMTVSYPSEGFFPDAQAA